MERGEGTIHEKDDILVVEDPTVTEKPIGEGAGGSTPTTTSTVSDGVEVEPRAGEHKGSPILAEWREGPHQVIERRTGPSGEVRLSSLRYISGNTDGFLVDVGRG